MPDRPRIALLEALEECGAFILATPEDADYFRQTIAALKPQPAPPVVVVKPTPVAPPPPPKPVAAIPKSPVEPEVAEEKIVAPAFDVSVFKHMMAKLAPGLAILDEIPSDAIARKIAERWKTKNQGAPISLLCYQEPPEQRALLEQIAKALSVYFGETKIVDAAQIEKEKQWETFFSVEGLKLTIVCDYTLWQLKHLLTFYKETPAVGERTLGGKALFLLPDLALYLKDPLLKRSLWKALCQKLS